MLPRTRSVWRRDSQSNASGKSGAVHSVKYEEVYLNAYASVPEARAGICRYIGFYNAVRPHSALGGRTPDQIYSAQPLLAAA